MYANQGGQDKSSLGEITGQCQDKTKCIVTSEFRVFPPETGLNFIISLTEMGENFTDSTSSSLELHTSLTKRIL